MSLCVNRPSLAPSLVLPFTFFWKNGESLLYNYGLTKELTNYCPAMAMDTHWSPIPILDTDWSPMIQYIKVTMYTSENAALSAKQDMEANRACGGDFLSNHAKREFTQLPTQEMDECLC